MTLNNLKIAPKLGILVGVALFGLCISGVLAGYLMKREMVDARIEQTKAIVEMGRNFAAALRKRVDAGELTKGGGDRRASPLRQCDDLRQRLGLPVRHVV